MRTIAALLLLFVGPAGADIIFWKFKDHRVVSPSERWCAIITRDGKARRVRFEIYERPATGAAAPAAPATVECPWNRVGRKLQPRPGDRLVGCGTADTLPLDTLFTDSLPRLVFIDSDEWGRGRLVTLIDPAGKERKRHDLKSLFPKRKRAFASTVSTTTWERGYFIDRDRLVIIVPRGLGKADRDLGTAVWEIAREPHTLRAVALDDGRVFTPEPECVLRFAADRKSGLREAALIIAGKKNPRGSSAIAERIAVDATDDWTIRMRAAEAAITLGSKRDFRPLFLEAAKPTNGDRWARAHAIRRLGRIVGMGALPLLRSILEEGQTRPNHPWDVSEALGDLGPSIAPTMIDWLAIEANHEDVRMTAAVHLSVLKPRAAIEPLYRAVSHGPEFVGMWAISALEEIGAPDRVERFCAILKRGGPSDAHLGWHFERHPTERAREALEIAKARPRGEKDLMGAAPYRAALERLDAIRKRRQSALARKPFERPPVTPGSRVAIPDTAVRIVPPPGFSIPAGGSRLIHASGASVSVSEQRSPFDEPASWFDAERMRKKRTTLESRREGTLDGVDALLIHTTSASSEKWIFIVGDLRSSVVVRATMPNAASRELSTQLRNALLTAEWRPKR